MQTRSVNSKLKTQNSELAIVALGSNLGDSRRIILEAMARLQNFSDRANPQIFALANVAGGLSAGFADVRKRGRRPGAAKG